MADAVLRARSVHKRFGGTRALRGVDFTLERGKIHALLGENGAGKSTLVNLMSGVFEPDEGAIEVNGRLVRLRTPADAQRHGIRTVHQELELAPSLSVAENVLMGQLPHRKGLVRQHDLVERCRRELAEIGADIDPRSIVGTLPLAMRQLVEIARGLAANPRVLFLDEPTAALTPTESDQLLDRLRKLAAQGVAILYISHHIDEVLSVADDVTILRDGQVVLTTATSLTNRAAVLSAMLGTDPGDMPSRTEQTDADDATENRIHLRVRGLAAASGLEEATFEAAEGEIVGFFGLAGSGHEKITECLYGATPRSADEAVFDGGPLPRTPRQARHRGMGYVAGDRKSAGLAIGLPVSDNLLMASYGRSARWGVRNIKNERRRAAELADRFSVKANSLDDAVASRSGGNQQKVAVARQFADQIPRLILLNEPTRGVDVGAKAEIHRLLLDYVHSGGTCVVSSSDAEEIAALCDRVYVLRSGRIVEHLSARGLTDTQLTAAAL